jgi:hypothetical protein
MNPLGKGLLFVDDNIRCCFLRRRAPGLSRSRILWRKPNFPVAPALTIHNSVAQFAALDLTYQGYVTPQGDANMQTPAGQTFVGHIDAYGKLISRTAGRCVYDATWQRREGPKPS